uniref:BZIP domain-containing protein n=1 Tax=Caenorhabditis japonica TaxID=281687 RepID=A0A8R1I054_CAEJA
MSTKCPRNVHEVSTKCPRCPRSMSTSSNPRSTTKYHEEHEFLICVQLKNLSSFVLEMPPKKDPTEEQKEKRREQNRLRQKAYRDRKRAVKPNESAKKPKLTDEQKREKNRIRTRKFREQRKLLSGPIQTAQEEKKKH